MPSVRLFQNNERLPWFHAIVWHICTTANKDKTDWTELAEFVNPMRITYDEERRRILEADSAEELTLFLLKWSRSET